MFANLQSKEKSFIWNETHNGEVKKHKAGISTGMQQATIR